jgi:predicted dehydrogenase
MEKMLESCHPEVVHILTPPASHISLGAMALEAGCNVLLEKPFTVNAQEADRLIKIAKSVEKKVTVNHFHNFSPPSLKLKKIIASKTLGDILHIEGFYGYSLKSPVAIALLKDGGSWIHRLPGKVLHNNINHLLAKITEFIPDENPKIFALGNRLSNEAKSIVHSFVNDELRVMIAGENVSAYATFSSNISPFQHFMRVYGTKNSILIDYLSRTMVFVSNSNLPGPFGNLANPMNTSKQYLLEGIKNIVRFAKSDFHFYAGMNKFLQLFYGSIRKDIEGPIPYIEIIKVTQMMDEIFHQING